MNTPFEDLPLEKTDDPDQQYQGEWFKGYDAYVVRMEAVKLKPRPFRIWITDFGYTHGGTNEH